MLINKTPSAMPVYDNILNRMGVDNGMNYLRERARSLGANKMFINTCYWLGELTAGQWLEFRKKTYAK